MRQQSWDIFKEKICRPSRLSQPGNLKEESTSGICKASPFASLRKALAGESSAQEVEAGQLFGVNGSGVWIIAFLLSWMVNGTVALVGVPVDLTVADTAETASPIQPRPKAADAGEHVKV